jgi:exodeoxyribonuclease-1
MAGYIPEVCNIGSKGYIDELKKLMFTKQAELPEGVERLQIKDLIFNKSPMFIPNVYKLEPKIVEQFGLRIQDNF